MQVNVRLQPNNEIAWDLADDLVPYPSHKTLVELGPNIRIFQVRIHPRKRRRHRSPLLDGLARSRGIEHGSHDFIVARAAAQVARQPVADLVFGRLRILVEQRFRRDQKAGRADSALKRGVFEEFLLQRVQAFRLRKPFDRVDAGRPALCDRQAAVCRAFSFRRMRLDSNR